MTGNPDKPMFKDAPVRVYANVPFATTTTPAHIWDEQKFDMMPTVFYGDPAPIGFTSLPDA